MTRVAAGCFLILMFTTWLSSAGEAGSGLRGQPAPMLILKDMNGADFYLRDYCGLPRGPRTRQEREALVLSFFTSWCKGCKVEIPVLQQLASEFSGQPVKFFLVNVGEPADTVESFVFNNVVTLPVLLDQYEVASRKYKVKELPTLVMIDREGIIKEYHTGFAPAYGDSIRHQVRSLLGMAPPEKAGLASARIDTARVDSAKPLDRPAATKKKTKK